MELSSSVRDPMVSVTCLPQTFHSFHPGKRRALARHIRCTIMAGTIISLWPLGQPLLRCLLLRTPFPLFRRWAVTLSNYTDRLYNWMSAFDTWLDTHYLLFSTNAIPTSLWPPASSIDQCRSHQMYPHSLTHENSSLAVFSSNANLHDTSQSFHQSLSSRCGPVSIPHQGRHYLLPCIKMNLKLHLPLRITARDEVRHNFFALHSNAKIFIFKKQCFS